jgi:hypothetical protein
MPFAPAPRPAAPSIPFSPPPPAQARPPSRAGSFGFDLEPPRPPRPAPPAPPPPPAPPVPAAAEDDWSDVELTPAEPRKVPAPAPPAPVPAPRSVPTPVTETRPASATTLELEPVRGYEPIELAAEEPSEPQLAPMHEFVPPAGTTGHQPAPLVPQGGAGVHAGQATPADGGEAVLREALSRASREVIERVVWEVVPQLAETIIRENLDRLVKARQG